VNTSRACCPNCHRCFLAQEPTGVRQWARERDRGDICGIAGKIAKEIIKQIAKRAGPEAGREHHNLELTFDRLSKTKWQAGPNPFWRREDKTISDTRPPSALRKAI
jgi:hypothetical protein